MKTTPNQLAEILKDPDWVNIGNLPSNFYPYDYGSLYIKPFTVKHLRLLSKSIVTKDISFQIQAVDMVITQSVYDLTIGDYYYILEWLKIHSTTKTPLVVEWHCKDTRLKHKSTGELISNDPRTLPEIAVTLDPDDYEVVPCTTHNTELLHMVNLEVHQLPEEGWEGLPVGFDFPRVKNLKEIQDALTNPELNMVVGPAQWVAGETLEEKIKLLDDQRNLDMFNTALALNSTIIHGIGKTATLNCRNCRSAHRTPIKIDSLSFFQ